MSLTQKLTSYLHAKWMARYKWWINQIAWYFGCGTGEKNGKGGGGSSQNYENPINPWHRNKDFWWLMQHLKYLHFMVFFTLLVWARESSQKKLTSLSWGRSLFLWPHDLKPENHSLFHVVFLKRKKTLRKKSKSPRNPIKPMEALVRNWPSLNLHMRCTPLFPVNLSILQPSGIHQSSVWSHPLRPPWDHSIPLGSRRPSPSGLITVYEHQPKQGQVWKGQFPPKSP